MTYNEFVFNSFKPKKEPTRKAVLKNAEKHVWSGRCKLPTRKS